MNLLEVIRLKYPEAKNGIDFQVGDKGDGKLFISYWGLADPKPTLTILNTWKAEYAEAYAVKQAQQSRINEYPSIEDQLDMQYHDQLEGTTVWIDTIQAIKLKYPVEE